ncbi:hypothetical protein I4U23_004245 [Adineta vaga]|nr:hypothetical protein I4U23_004245 [Adineta vaga]
MAGEFSAETIHLYNSDRLSNNELFYQCLYYYPHDPSILTADLEWSQQIIPFCLRPLQPSMDKYYNEGFVEATKCYTFKELRQDNFTARQLFSTSAPIDFVERYQILVDGMSDCFEGFDEKYDKSCLLEQHQRYKCSYEEKCLSFIAVENDNIDCVNGDDEFSSEQRSRLNWPPFPMLCDIYQDMYSVLINGYNETDETSCEMWPCNNVYTKCDGLWHCPNGIDEINCSNSHCSSDSHPCISMETLNLTCITLEKAGDGRVDCLGGTDEQMYCQQTYPDSPTVRYHCWNDTRCLSTQSLCNRHTYPSESLQCPHREDQTLCPIEDEDLNIHFDRRRGICSEAWDDQRTVSEQLLCNLANDYESNTLIQRPTIYTKFRPTTDLLRKSFLLKVTDSNFALPSNTSRLKVSPSTYEKIWYCNRGILIRLSESRSKRCLCPPNYYGDRCEYQSQRVALTLEFQPEIMPVQQTIFSFVVMLIDNESQINSYEKILYTPRGNCDIKFNINLLFATRPKNISNEYYIHINGYVTNNLQYHISWLIAIPFQFLPVNRIANVLKIPARPLKYCSMSCGIHGQCTQYENSAKLFCKCAAGWSGHSCNIQIDCNCSSDSICTGNANNRSICVCPLGKIGPRCYIESASCHENECKNGGLCIPFDERKSEYGYKCICNDQFTGLNCEKVSTKITISFVDIPKPSFISIHFITALGDQPLYRLIKFQKIPYDVNLVTLRQVVPFQLLFIEINQIYYLTIVRENFILWENISVEVTSSQKCLNVRDLFNNTVLEYHLLRRMKYYHLPCQNNKELVCFYDEKSMCICNSDQQANCYENDLNQISNCKEMNPCYNDAHCLQDRLRCPTSYTCICLECYHGSLCQFSTRSLGVSLDSIIGYQIQPHLQFARQPYIVKFIVILTVLLIALGYICSVLSILTFNHKNSRDVGCGTYLLASSWVLSMMVTVLGIKTVQLILTQMHILTRHEVVLVSCYSLDALLNILLEVSGWLTACVAIERTVSVIKKVSFDKTKNAISIHIHFVTKFHHSIVIMGVNKSRLDQSRSMARQPGKYTSNSQVFPLDQGIQRLAIDPSGSLGSLYDATKDQLLSTSPLYISKRSISLRNEVNPVVVTSGRLKARDLLDMIGIDKELYLSIYLNLTTTKGISLLNNYPFTINEYSRYFFFHHKTKHSYLAANQYIDGTKDNPTILSTNIDATHIVTEIQYGIHVVVFLQLAPTNVTALDELLEKIQAQLARNIFSVKSNDKLLYEQFTDLKVFTNINEITNLTKLEDICQKITQIRSNVYQYPPMKYTLRPVRTLCSWFPSEKGIFVPLNQTLINQTELYLYELSSIRKQVHLSIPSAKEQSILTYFKPAYDDLQQRQEKINQSYPKKMSRLRASLLAIRCGNIKQNEMKESLIDHEATTLLRECQNIIIQRERLIEKVQLVNELKQRNIEYWNVKELLTSDNENLDMIEEELMRKRPGKRIFCFDDDLQREYLGEWNKYTEQFFNEEKTSDLVFADFSFCSTQPSKMKVISLNEVTGPRKSLWEDSFGKGSARKRLRFDPTNLSTNKYVNILLLGEIQVGKTTFINALINYLKLESFDKACADKPLTLIPVSFPLAVGDQFEEHIIQLGGIDSNEDHLHPGQSVTQQCKSYIIPINSQFNIRLIDTPGMGDTRGLEQDDLIMQHILSYINSLPYINAVCILLKPNESKLNILFRSYFTQLLSFLGEKIRNNIIFCFTHTRATFFAPGNTVPLLKKLLHSNSIKNISLKKMNTFCFDNEAFRYLIARQNGLQFDVYQKEEYQRSWEISVKETTHFLQYICRDLKPCDQKNWQSVENAQWQINKMIRPMLETIRNNIRNILLVERVSSKTFIQLHPSAVQRYVHLCLKCPPILILCQEFWIVSDNVHIFSDRCDKCQCTSTQHSKVNYVLKYETTTEKRKQSLNDMKTSLDLLKQWVIGLSDFFRYILRIPKENDPILSSLNRMMEEEKNIVIAKQQQQGGPNYFLYDELKNFRKEYEKFCTMSISARKPTHLTDIYKLIRNLSKDRIINEQLDAIKQTQQIYIHEQEKCVS